MYEQHEQITLKTISKWAADKIPWIADKCQVDQDSAQFIFMQAVKLGEEVGELHAEILASAQAQSASKLKHHSKSSLESELADVLLCVAILAEANGVDLESAVKAKLALIEERAT